MVNNGRRIDNFVIGGVPVKVIDIKFNYKNIEENNIRCQVKSMLGSIKEETNRLPKKYKVTIEMIVEETDGK